MIEEICRLHHDHPLAGHLGVARTTSRIRENYYWNGMFRTIKKYVRLCEVCQVHKPKKPTLSPPLRFHDPGAAFADIGIDITGPFMETEAGNFYILVMQDQFTKWPEAVAIPNKAAATVAEAFFRYFIC